MLRLTQRLINIKSTLIYIWHLIGVRILQSFNNFQCKWKLLLVWRKKAKYMCALSMALLNPVTSPLFRHYPLAISGEVTIPWWRNNSPYWWLYIKLWNKWIFCQQLYVRKARNGDDFDISVYQWSSSYSSNKQIVIWFTYESNFYRLQQVRSFYQKKLKRFYL